MASETVDTGRRRFLTVTTAVVGAAGAAGLAVPFLASWQPSERAQAAGAPVEADVSRLEPGQILRVEWRGQPVWLVRRTEEMLNTLELVSDRLSDPDSRQSEQPVYARNPHRSLKPELLVLIGICTHLGCSPLYVPQVGPQPFDSQWQGGFFCPCHASRFDLAGRVFAGMPAPTNLRVPPYRFIDDERVLVGEHPEGVA